MATLGGTIEIQFIGSTAIEKNQGIVFLVINSYSKDPHHRHLWTDTALRAYTKTFHNHLFFGVVPLPDVESFEEVFEKLPEFAHQVEAIHYQYVALAFVGHGKQVDGYDCLLTNNHLRPTRISDIIAEFEKAFKHKLKLFFFDMCRESNHPDPSRILLGPHLQLPQNSYVVFSTQCDSKAWDYAYQPGSHKYSVWSEHFNELISTVVDASLSQVIASINRRLKSINQKAQVIDHGDIGKHVLLPERDGREFTNEDKVALEMYKSFMNVVRLGHGSTSIIVHDLLQPFYNKVLEIIREILEDQQRSDGLAHVQHFLQRCLNVSADVIVGDIHTIFRRQSAGFFCYDLNLFKGFVQEFPNPNLQAALSALETVQSEIHSDSHTPYHFAKVEFQVDFHTFEVQNVPVAFVLNGSSFTHNCQSGVELVEFLKGIFPGVYFAGIKEGCLMAIFVFDLLLALQLPVLLHSHLPRLTDLTVTEVYISDLVRISVCNGKIMFLGSGEELTELCEVYEEKLAVEKNPVHADTLRSARDIVSKLYVETSEQSLPHSEMPGGPLAPLRMFLTRLKEYLPSWRFLSHYWVSHRSQEPDMVKPSVLDEPLQEPSHAPLDKPLDEQMGKESMVEPIMAKTTIGSMMIKPSSMGNTSQIPLGTPSRHLKEVSHPQKDNTIGIAVVFNNRRSKDAGMKWKETLEKVKLDVRMIEGASEIEIYRYLWDVYGHKKDPNSYLVFVFIVDDAEKCIGYTGLWWEDKCRTLVFFDTSEPPSDPHLILISIFVVRHSPLIVAFSSEKYTGFVRQSISEDGGLGELVEMFGVEWSSDAMDYSSSWSKIFICYCGTVDNWDLFKDARRLESKEEFPRTSKEEVPNTSEEEVPEKSKEMSKKSEGMMLIESGRQESSYTTSVEASHFQKDNTIGIAVVVNNRRSEDAGLKWKETLEKVKLDVRMIEDVSQYENYKYTEYLSGHKRDPNSYLVFVYIVDDAEKCIGYTGFWLEGKCRTLVFFDTSEPPSDPHLILYPMFNVCRNPLIVAFCSGKSSGFVRKSISKDGGLRKLVELFGVEWSGDALDYPNLWPKLIICYHGKVDNWDLFKDARRLESKEELPRTSKEEVPNTSEEELPKTSEEELPKTSKEEVSKTSKEELPKTSKEEVSGTSEEEVPKISKEDVLKEFKGMIPKTFEGKTTRTQSTKLTTPQDHKDTVY